MAANILGVPQQHNITQYISSAQQNTSKVMNSHQAGEYGSDSVSLSNAIVRAANASGSKNSDGTTAYAEQPENRSRSVKAAKNNTVKAISDEEKESDSNNFFKKYLPLASQLKGMLGGLIGIITKGEA